MYQIMARVGIVSLIGLTCMSCSAAPNAPEIISVIPGDTRPFAASFIDDDQIIVSYRCLDPCISEIRRFYVNNGSAYKIGTEANSPESRASNIKGAVYIDTPSRQTMAKLRDGRVIYPTPPVREPNAAIWKSEPSGKASTQRVSIRIGTRKRPENEPLQSIYASADDNLIVVHPGKGTCAYVVNVKALTNDGSALPAKEVCPAEPAGMHSYVELFDMRPKGRNALFLTSYIEMPFLRTISFGDILDGRVRPIAHVMGYVYGAVAFDDYVLVHHKSPIDGILVGDIENSDKKYEEKKITSIKRSNVDHSHCLWKNTIDRRCIRVIPIWNARCHILFEKTGYWKSRY